MFILIFSIHGQSDDTPFAVKVSPGIGIPVGADTEFYKLGGGAGLSGIVRMPFLPLLSAGIDIGYHLGPLNMATDPLSLSFIAGGALIGVNFDVSQRFLVSLYGKGGYFYGLINGEPDTGEGNFYVGGGFGAYYRMTPFFSLGLEGGYRNFLGLYNDFTVNLGALFHVGSRMQRSAWIEERSPGALPEKAGSDEASDASGGGVEITNFEFENIFPVFYKYYNKNPLGRITVRNNGESAIENIQISFLVKQYMDNAKAAGLIEKLEPGEEKDVDVVGLFTNKVLDITEGTLVSALIDLKYIKNNEEFSREYIESIRIQNRNAVTWDDDSKACSFVTAKDPAVLKFSKNVAAWIKGAEHAGVAKNMLLAIALHEALDLYGISYVVDPTTPYTEYSENAMAIDYLQFPKQTLEVLAGDCDDLSILYSALLEAVGIETAFVTTPGHIFVALNLDMSADEAKRRFLYPEDLIFRGDQTWLPVEITDRSRGFLKAWTTGAKEWREAAAVSLEGFVPMHPAWEIYEPVGFPGTPVITMPDRQQMVTAYVEEVDRFIQREIDPQESKLMAEMQNNPGNSKYVNRLGVLYARYGLVEKATQQFELILQTKEYVPTLINMGNLYYISDEFGQAKTYYERAQQISPNDPKVLLSVACVNHELENYGTVRDAYDKLKSVDPSLAERFAYLELRGQDAARAADVTNVKGVVVWDEE